MHGHTYAHVSVWKTTDCSPRGGLSRSPDASLVQPDAALTPSPPRGHGAALDSQGDSFRHQLLGPPSAPSPHGWVPRPAEKGQRAEPPHRPAGIGSRAFLPIPRLPPTPLTSPPASDTCAGWAAPRSGYETVPCGERPGPGSRRARGATLARAPLPRQAAKTGGPCEDVAADTRRTRAPSSIDASASPAEPHFSQQSERAERGCTGWVDQELITQPAGRCQPRGQHLLSPCVWMTEPVSLWAI